MTAKRISSLCQLPPITLTYWVSLNCYLKEKQNYVFLLSFFFAAAHFHLVSISSFSHRLFKLSNFSSNEIGLSLFFSFLFFFFFFFFYLTLYLFLCYPRQCRHQNWSRKIESALLLLLFLSQKVREAMRFTAETHECFKVKISSGLTWRGDVRTDDLLGTQIS